YSAATGLGWQNSGILGFDRGTPNSMLRDGQYGTHNTFLADLPSGSYLVTATVGDAAALHDNIDILVGGSSVLGGSLITTAAGQFAVRSFTVTVSTDQLALQFLDRGGVDPNFVINALDITPTANVASITFTSGPGMVSA